MKERPILFDGAMVRAALSGAKTQTRRPVRASRGRELYVRLDDEGVVHVDECWCQQPELLYSVRRPCEPGDTLWVRETFAANVPGCDFQGGYAYRADHQDPRGDGPANPMRWTPSILMPRVAARLFLRVTDVRAQRLQSITESDAEAEGFTSTSLKGTKMQMVAPDGEVTVSELAWSSCHYAFATTWHQFYGDTPVGWAANPWVWVISFQQLKKEDR